MLFPRTLPQWLYGGAAALFLLHQVTERILYWRLPWIDNYWDDLLALPLLLGLWQWERQRWWGLPALGPSEIAIFTLLSALLFELVFPYWSDAFTADAWDVVAYAAGSGLFWWVNQPGPTIPG